MSVTAGVSDTVIAIRDKLRGKIGQTKVKRYWPGKVPEWADDEIEDAAPVDIRPSREAALEKAFPRHEEDAAIVRKDDRRLRRLAESRIDNREEVRADHRRIRQAEIVSTIEEEARMQEGLELEEQDENALAERRRLIKEKKRRLEERRIETKQIVVEEIRKDEEIQKNMEMEANIADVDTDDEINEAEEYEAWKVREIGRIKRDREDREAMKNPKPAPPPKQKWRFMQKYYHKGAFFQSESDDQAATVGSDGIFTRDFSAPTGEDKMDKTILPKVMQVKHFGRSGRTKWTHLVNEDTTDWNNPWTYNDPLRAKYNDRMAAMNAPIAKPKGSRKLKDWESR
uniref:Microfibrillar-associated protein 1 n=1 Tax=Cajanus cajan TaxID=3821 RepID=A0A151RHS4_CAJCA|nr:Microfibrillar-associated protein 1 [Cajanus cajan]